MAYLHTAYVILSSRYDSENMPIKEAKGRFLEVMLRHPDGSEEAKTSEFRGGRFIVKVSGLDLSRAGTYAVWLNKIFGWDAVRDTNASLSLPTRSHARAFTVTQNDPDLNIILGGLVGAVAAACVGLLLFYVRKHPQRVMKVC